MEKGDSLGIPNYGPWYLKTLPGQDTIEEMRRIEQFISLAIESNIVPEFQGTKKLEFINYGSTQLVFVLTVNESKQYTFLVNQPATEFGTGKSEFENLQLLSNKHENVIKPLHYFEDNKGRELYVTPYDYQSRCIGVEIATWGIWIPEPSYHFKNFNDKQKAIINSSMVASLINFYDEEKKKGIAACRLDGGDFMIGKGFENHEINYENILQKIKLIAARKLVTIELDEYVNLIREELSQMDQYENVLLGKRLRAGFDNSEIEDGIKLGLQLREKNKTKKLSRSIL